MESYYFIFDTFAFVNTILLIVYGFLSIVVLKKSNNKILKIVAFYLLCSSFFDLLSSALGTYLSNGLMPLITYRICELFIIGYLINKHWLKSQIVWLLIGLSSLYLFYDLFTYKANGILNYEARAQTTATVLLVGLIVVNLLKQLKNYKSFSITNQMLCMVFLGYFSIHLVYTVIQNFIINQSFNNKSFALFYSSYALLHIVYYAALAFILFRNLKTHN